MDVMQGVGRGRVFCVVKYVNCCVWAFCQHTCNCAWPVGQVCQVPYLLLGAVYVCEDEGGMRGSTQASWYITCCIVRGAHSSPVRTRDHIQCPARSLVYKYSTTLCSGRTVCVHVHVRYAILERFVRSMLQCYNKWRHVIGYHTPHPYLFS